MNAAEVLGLIVTILALLGGLEMRVRSLVKTYLQELIPNGGNSIKDQVNRLDSKIDELYKHLLNK